MTTFSLEIYCSNKQIHAQNYNRNTGKRCEICSELSIKTTELCHRRRLFVFIANCEHISHVFMVFLFRLWPATSLKTPTWMFSYEFYEIFEKILFLQNNKQLRGLIKNHRCFFYFLFDIILFSHLDGKNYNHQTILINILPGKSIKGLQI